MSEVYLFLAIVFGTTLGLVIGIIIVTKLGL